MGRITGALTSPIGKATTAFAVVATFLVAPSAAQAAPGDYSDIVIDGATSLNSELLLVAAAVVVFAAGLLAIRKGWSWVRGMLR